MKESRLEGRKPGMNPLYYDILTYEPDEFAAATEWGKQQGYTEFNIRTIDLSTPPDFTKILA